MGHDSERVVSGLISERDLARIREAVGIQVEKIYDSCKEKDCVENARVYFEELTDDEICAINNAFNVKIRAAEVEDVITDIEAIPFKRGFYTVDVKYIIEVTLDFFTKVVVGGKECVHVTTVEGEVSFDKKIFLFGSEGGVKVFKSMFQEHRDDLHCNNSELQQTNLPFAKIEVAEPIPLGAKLRGLLDKFCDEEEATTGPILTKRVYVTIGLFSIVNLARYVQLLVPAFDFSYPYKRCPGATEDNPCELFDTFEFPYDEFYPPQKFDFPGVAEQERLLMDEGHEDKE